MLMKPYHERKKIEAFQGLPAEFIVYIEAAAYERGHSAGQEEVDMLAVSMAHDLRPVIAEYTARIQTECWGEGSDEHDHCNSH